MPKTVPAASTGTTPQMSAAQLNMAQRQAVLRSAVHMRQQIAAGTITPSSNPTINVSPRFVGLGMRFIVEVLATINNTGGTTINATDFNLANLIQQVQVVDLNNYTRIQTIGAHLALLATAKRKRPYGATANWNNTYTVGGANNLSQMLDTPPAYWPVFQGPTSIGAGTNGTVRGVFEIPLAYSDDDLRGAIYLNVVNSTANIQITFNTNAVGATTADTTFALYNGAAGTAGTITSLSYVIYQEYLDQLPIANGRVILPVLDLSTVYELKNTNFTALTQNQDFPIPFSNFRDFLSTFLIFNHDGGSGRTTGTDVNYFALQSANFTNLWKQDALLCAQLAREHVPYDLPAGTYYFPSRRRPISTTQYGNMEIILNASTVGASPYVQALWEDFALQNTLVTAGSLAAS